MIDLAVINGSIISPPVTNVPATVAIHEGRIQAILDPNERVEAAQVIDAAGMLVLPGAIDIHFHCRAPAFPQRGTFATETRAAAAGGVTTIFEMPISKPCVSTVEIWETRRELVERDAYVNVGLYAAPGLCDANEITGMAEAGAIGFKIFLTQPPPGREDEFSGLCVENIAVVAEALQLIQPTGLRCVFHAEDQSLIDHYTARAEAMDGPDYRRHAQSRPGIVESTAVAMLVALAQELSAPIHIAHVSSEATVEILQQARQMQAPVTSETCPHYLYFTDDILEKIGPHGKINPPIRYQEDQTALWGALLDGTLDVIATDHAPFTLAEKEATWGNILEAPPGHPGVEALVQLTLTEALNGRFSLMKATELISTRPAQLFNLFPQKGIIWPGSDADITIYDPREEKIIQRSDWLTNAAECNRLYDGMPVQGETHATIVGGKVIFQAGEIVGESGDGGVVRPIKQ